MTVRTSPWPAGVPCWADLSAPDVAAAAEFYRAVLGWTTTEPDEEHGGYVLAQVDGHAAAGLGPAQPEQASAWTLYFSTDDADASAAAASQAGGTVVAGPFDVGPLGRMAVVVDPSGAPFGLWQAGVHIGAAHVNAPGGLVWEDLRSTDPRAARDFYGALLGLRFDAVEMAPEDYTTFASADEPFPLGGLGGLMGGSEPSHWLVYFGVEDADRACDAVRTTGGSVLSEPFDTPYGRMALVLDPAGARFVVLQQPVGAPQPDRAG